MGHPVLYFACFSAAFYAVAVAGPPVESLDMCKLWFVRCLLGGTAVIDLRKEVTKCCQSNLKSKDFRSEVDDCIMNATAMPCAEGMSKRCQEMMEKEAEDAKSSEVAVDENIQVPDKGSNCDDYANKYRQYVIDDCIASEKGKVQEYCKNLK